MKLITVPDQTEFLHTEMAKIRSSLGGSVIAKRGPLGPRISVPVFLVAPNPTQRTLDMPVSPLGK